MLWQGGTCISCTACVSLSTNTNPMGWFVYLSCEAGSGCLSLSHHPSPATAWKQQHHQELWTGPSTSAATCVCCSPYSRSVLTRTEIIQGKHIKKTFACFQLKSAVYCESRIVRSELVSFQLREGLWTHELFIEPFGKQLFPISAILITGTAQVLSKIKQSPIWLSGVHPCKAEMRVRERWGKAESQF